MSGLLHFDITKIRSVDVSFAFMAERSIDGFNWRLEKAACTYRSLCRALYVRPFGKLRQFRVLEYDCHCRHGAPERYKRMAEGNPVLFGMEGAVRLYPTRDRRYCKPTAIHGPAEVGILSVHIPAPEVLVPYNPSSKFIVCRSTTVSKCVCYGRTIETSGRALAEGYVLAE